MPLAADRTLAESLPISINADALYVDLVRYASMVTRVVIITATQRISHLRFRMMRHTSRR